MKIDVWLFGRKLHHRAAHVGSQDRIERFRVVAVGLISELALFVVYEPAVSGHRDTADEIADSDFVERFETAIAERQVERLAGSRIATRVKRTGISIVDVYAVTFFGQVDGEQRSDEAGAGHNDSLHLMCSSREREKAGEETGSGGPAGPIALLVPN